MMGKLYQRFVYLLVGISCVWAQCPPSANIEPCTCYESGFYGLVLSCNGIDTEEELRSILHGINYPDTKFNEIRITGCGMESLGADLFGEVHAAILRIENHPNLTSIDPNFMAGPMTYQVRVLEITANPRLQVADLGFLEDVLRTDLMLEMYDNAINNVISPTKPSNVYSLNLGRNAITTLTTQTLANLQGLTYLYLYENGMTSIEAGSFTSLTSMKELQIHQNQLGPTLPPGAFAMPPTLSSMTLDNNNIIDVLPLAITGFAPDAFLSLNSNKLKSFPEETFRPILEQLAEGGGTLSVGYNWELPCDCSIVWMFLTPEVMDALQWYNCGDWSHPITSIDSEALIQSCSRRL